MKKIYSALLFFVFFEWQFISTLNAQSCWSPLGGVGQNSYSDGITAMAVFNGNLVAAGYFDTVGGIAANDVAVWNGNSWSALGAGVNKIPYYGFYNGINAMAVYNNELYVAGSFDTAGGQPVNSIAKWDGTSWSSVGGGVGGYISGGDTITPEISCMAVYNGSLYVAGGFYTAGGIVTNNIASWNGTAWSAVGTGIGDQGQNGIDCLTSSNGLLYAGGAFFDASGLSALNIASWNGTTWAALGSGIGPDTLGQGGVLSITPYDGYLLAAVASDDAQYEQVFSIAKWDGTSWTSFAGGPGTGTYYPGIIITLFPFKGDLIAEGSFYEIGNDTSAQGLEIWNGATWSNFGGANDTALYYTAAIYNEHLYVGGAFAGIGAINTLNLAEYTCETTNGISQLAGNSIVHVYPNPTGGLVNLSVENLENNAAVQIYNLWGESVYQGLLNQGKNEIDLTAVAKGAYFYRVTGFNNESVATGTFVVQ